MKVVRIAFDILPDGSTVPKGYEFMKCHLIFDIKMEDFRRKARLVAGGHMTSAPATMTCTSVAADIENAYITAPITEKVWCILGQEFGEQAGRKAIIVRALYGLKSAGAAFRKHLADCMRHMGYKPCLTVPNLWMQPKIRPDDGFKYYSYMLIYVDDVLAIDHDSDSVLLRLDKYFKLKQGSVGDPDMYLGAKIRLTTLPNGVNAWGMSPSKYVQEAVRNCQDQVRTNLEKFSLPKRAENPFSMGYEPELDTSRPLDPEEASYYQSIIGIMRWKDFYGDVNEAIPTNVPKPLGKEVDVRAMVGSDHAGDKETRRSRTGFMIFVNMALIGWLSKKQPTIETSVFGAEFVALKNVMESLRALRYKLRMMGVPISGPSFTYGDNMSVIHNTQRPESTLKKKE
ncbi:hypothetical protein ACHAXR_003692 [Thalassiosira sp. AJA248-18]